MTSCHGWSKPVGDPGLPRWQSCKESCCQCRSHRRLGFDPWIGKIPWRRKWQPSPVFLPEESHGQKSLEGYSPWGCKELDMTEVTERTHTHTGFLGSKTLRFKTRLDCGQTVTTDHPKYRPGFNFFSTLGKDYFPTQISSRDGQASISCPQPG